VKPYATYAPADWMSMTASDLLDRYLPTGWRERSYGDLLRASPSDWMGWMYPQYAGAQQAGGQPYTGMGPYAAVQPYAGMSPPAGPQRYGTPMTAQAKNALYDVPRHHRHRPPHPHGCRCPACSERECCRHCGPDPCECLCCIGEVDFVLYARVGEQRMIPIVVEDERQREKDITVELGPWRARGGGAAPVDTVTVEPKTFKLPPCGEKEVVILARVREPSAVTPAPDTETGNMPGVPEGETQRELRDVDGCVVVTADLTLVGCDHRPIRIAIAILPRECDPFRLICGCGCC
jgi:hypothetical protein